MKRPFFVVVPTRERAETLHATLLTCVAQDYDSLTIIVSDNDSRDHTREVVGRFDDPRIRYVNPGQRVSMARNFEFALSHVGPGYAITLGDDDGLAHGAIEAANDILDAEPVEAITTERAQYDWPGMEARRANQIAFTTRSGWEVRATADYYPDVLNGWLSYYQIPLIYQCVFSTDVVARIVAKTGRIFASQQLDIYSSMLFGGLIPRYIHSWRPLIINGASPKSNGAQHFGQVKDVSEIRKWELENDLPLRRSFEFVKSIRLLLIESYLQATDLFPDIATAYPLDARRAFGNALVEVTAKGDPEERNKILRMAEAHGISLDARPAPLRVRSLTRRIARYTHWLANFSHNLIVDCGRLGVHDVAGASELMRRAFAGDERLRWSAQDQLALGLRRR